MPTFTRVVILEDATHILIRDELGNEVKFESIEEFNRCAAGTASFTGKHYIGYETAINFYQDSENVGIGVDDIPNPDYEWLIDNVTTLQTRKANVAYNRTEAEAIPLLVIQLSNDRMLEHVRRHDLIGGAIETKAHRNAERRKTRLNRKEAKGQTTTADRDWLDAQDVISDQLDILSGKDDLLDDYITNAARTLQELQTLDVTAAGHWV